MFSMLSIPPRSFLHLGGEYL